MGDAYHVIYFKPGEDPNCRVDERREFMVDGALDVALAKRCVQANIPMPPRGYWAKLQAGVSKPKRPPLPLRLPGARETVSFEHDRYGAHRLTDEDLQLGGETIGLRTRLGSLVFQLNWSQNVVQLKADAMDDDAANLATLVDYWTPLLLRMSVEAGIVESFGNLERQPAAVAAETGTHAPTLARVLRALASRGVFESCSDGAYRLSALGRRLLTNTPDSLAGLAAFRPWEIHAWAEVDHTRRTGEPAFPHNFGHGFWDHLAANPHLSNKFNEQMLRRTATMLGLGLSLYDWPSEGTIVDVGGGNGLLLSQVLQRVPALQGVLFDLPHVVEEADMVLHAAGVANRVKVVAGNLFADSLPLGHEIYVLASVLHDWGDSDAERILQKCHEAVPANGRLLIFESVLPEGPQQNLGKMVDLHMLVLFGGKERTEPEWRLLLHRCGFAVTKIVPTKGLSWIEAMPLHVE